MIETPARNGGKALATLLVLGVVGLVAGLATFAAFSSTTTNEGNTFASGTVVLADNDLEAVMYNVSNQKPGVDTVKCIKLTYTGSLDADVKLYTTSTVNASGQHVNLTVEKGTSDSSTFPNCGTFTSDSTIYNGDVSDFASTKNSYANGVSAFPGAATKWVATNTVVYRFTLSVDDVNAAQNANTGAHTFTWEARNQ